MDYEQSLHYIHTRVHRNRYLGSEGLAHTRLLMQRLGDPQKRLRCLHIAGSSGKGSTAAMCESVLRQAGFKTGLFVSPFVFDFRERIQLDGAPVEQELLASVLTEMRPVLDAMEAEGQPCTEFETLTALGFCIFARQRVDFAVIEVGIGGLMDCTNIIEPPLVAAICSISLEHTEILGHSIPEIAAQKCGILKPGCRAAGYCDLQPQAQAVLEQTCLERDIPLYQYSPAEVTILREDVSGTLFSLAGEQYFVPLAGRHQVWNALTVLAATDALRDSGIPLSRDVIRDGIAQTTFPGRMQTVRQSPLCLLDGAHNPEKLSALCAALEQLYPGRDLIAVLGMMRRKDYCTAIPMLARRCRAVVCVPAEPDSPQALSGEEVAALAIPYCSSVYLRSNAREGARLALSLASPEDVIVATGSIYLLADAKSGFADEI